jgi:hypothetical protein
MSFKDKLELKTLSAPNPVCPQRGPYEASEGIYPVMGKRKLGVGKPCLLLTQRLLFSILSQIEEERGG